MGHSKTQGRRRLALPLPLRAKMTGLAIFVCGFMGALLHDSTAARVGALFQLLVQGTTAQDFGLPNSAIRLRM